MADFTSIPHLKLTSEEAPAAPDSTTSMFVEGEDVLVDRNHSGQFFMGTIVQIDRVTEKCLLRFLDNKECWAHLNELQRVKDDPEEILCVVCKKIDQNVVRCPKCGRGYHRSCSALSIPDGVSPSSWLCVRCGNKTLKKKRGRLSLSSKESNVEQSQSALTLIPNIKASSSETISNVESYSNLIPVQSFISPSTSQDYHLEPVKKHPIRSFPYSLYPLVWDEQHRVNDSQQYCYCGKPGDWYMQMLQCASCRQWFHQNCLSCLHFPLYCGDQMYLFLCSVCNDDDEFLRRFDFGWVDIVHLSIFNLILFKKKKYFDVDSEIIPYVKNNWFYLQIPAQLVRCSDSELRRIILKMLEDNSTRNLRFKSGREINTKKRIWGLRTRVPPKRIPFSLPPVRPLTDDAVQSWWKKCHISFRKPLDSKFLMRNEMVLQPEGCMSTFNYNLMLGGASCALNVTSQNLREVAIGIHLLDTSILRHKFTSGVSVNGEQVSGQSSESFTGYAKKSSAFCAPNRLALQESLRRNRRALRNRCSPRRKALRKKEFLGIEQSGDVLENSSQDGYDSVDSPTSLSLDENYTSSNAVSLDEESQDENDVSQDGYDSSEEESDLSVVEESVSSVNGTTSGPISPVECQSGDSQDEDDPPVMVTENVSTENIVCMEENQIQLNGEDLQGSNQSEKSDGLLVLHLDPINNQQIATNQSLIVAQPLEETLAPLPVTYSVVPSILSTPADTEADEDSVGVPDVQVSCLPTIADLIGSPIVLDKKPITPLIPSLPRLTPVIKEPPQARAVKRKLSEKDIKIVNGQVKQRRRLRRIQSNHAVGTKTVHLDSGEKLEKRIVGGKLLRSPLKPPIPEATPETSQAQGGSSSASSASSFVPYGEMSVSDVKKNIKCIFNARNRISAGEKFLIKGRRVTADGVEYLIQWDYSL